MYYVSTRSKQEKLTAAQAIARGLAADGGLLTPESFPTLTAGDLERLKDMTYQQRAVEIMGRYLDDFSAQELSGFALSAYGPDKFDDPAVAPVRTVDGATHCLEL